MARTESTMAPLGSIAPDFSLPDPSGKVIHRSDFKSQPLLVMFICNHCPYVQHVSEGLAQLARDYMPRGLAIVGINSNDASKYLDDSPAKMAEEIDRHGYIFPYVVDESQSVAKAYKAACTPDFFLYDSKHALVYRGQFDDSRPQNGKPVTGADLRRAIDTVLAGQAVNVDQKPSLGCNIKWK